MLVLLCLMTGTVSHAKATEFKGLFEDSYVGLDEPVQHGSYYFKYQEDGIYMADAENGSYKKTSLTYDSLTDGTKAYYVQGRNLYAYTLSTGKAKKIKKLPAKKEAYFSVSMVYNNRIFLTLSSYDEFRYLTYQYNMKTKKLKLIKKDCNLVRNYGTYAVSFDQLRTDVSPTPVTLYRITSSSLKKIKKLTSDGMSCRFIRGKLYYIEYDSYMMQKMTIYRCKPNGSGKKKLAELSARGENGVIYMQEMYADKCKVFMGDGTYIYTYATKQLENAN